VPDGQRVSEQERLRQAPRRTSGKAMTGALDRVSEVLALGARSVSADAVPANRLAALARYGLTAKAPALRDLVEPRKTVLATERPVSLAGLRGRINRHPAFRRRRPLLSFMQGPARLW
jgi:hypothetical protein